METLTEAVAQTAPDCRKMNDIEAGQLCDSTHSALVSGTGRLGSVPGLIRRIITEQAWTRRKVPMHGVVELSSLRELITTKPLRGWGEDPAKIEAVIKDDPEVLAMWREEMTGEPHRPKKEASHDNVMTSKQGNSRSYTVARLQKQHPQLFEDVKAGRLSPNAAAIKAGFRKIKTPLEQLCHWWQKASAGEREEFERTKARLT